MENKQNRISVQQFISEFNAIKLANAKGDYVAKHIVVDYVNYEDKVALCSRIINASMYMSVGSSDKKERFFRQDTPARMMNHALALIDTYTDIEIRFGEHVLEDYNALEKEGLTDLIINFIPEVEVERIGRILDMKIDDFYENERSMGKVYDSFTQGINAFVGSFTEEVEKLMKNPDMIMDLFEKI